VRESDFHPVDGSVHRLGSERVGSFEFAPSERLDLDLVDRMLVSARDEVDSIDTVLLPESAVEETTLTSLKQSWTATESLCCKRGSVSTPSDRGNSPAIGCTSV
jgi:hypothetical protein